MGVCVCACMPGCGQGHEATLCVLPNGDISLSYCPIDVQLEGFLCGWTATKPVVQKVVSIFVSAISGGGKSFLLFAPRSVFTSLPSCY